MGSGIRPKTPTPQSYLLILQAITRNSCPILSSFLDWGQNGAKQSSTNLPAEICLKSSRLRAANTLSGRYRKAPKQLKQKRRLVRRPVRYQLSGEATYLRASLGFEGRRVKPDQARVTPYASKTSRSVTTPSNLCTSARFTTGRISIWFAPMRSSAKSSP